MQNFVSYVTELGFRSIEVMTVPPESYNRPFLKKTFQIFVSPPGRRGLQVFLFHQNAARVKFPLQLFQGFFFNARYIAARLR